MRSDPLGNFSVLLVKLIKGGKKRVRGVEEGHDKRPGISDRVYFKLSSNVPCQCSELYGCQ